MDTCCLCMYWVFEYEDDYSDITPGDGVRLQCLKGHYYYDKDSIGHPLQGNGKKTWHEVFTMSRTCPDAEHATSRR